MPLGLTARAGDSALEGRGLVVVRGGARILDGASLTVRRGDAISIQGPSGSGKSTFVRALATLIPIDGGEILLDGSPARSFSPMAFRRRVAYLAQAPALFPGTVADNVAAGPALRGEQVREPERLLEQVALDRSFLGRDAGTLSGGEKQRVAIARALANAPEVLLLDEPTAALDPAAGERIVDLARRLAQGGLAVVMVTHDAAAADRLGGVRYRCERGRVERAR